MSTAFEVAPDGVISLSDEVLRKNRLGWLAALESDEWQQGTGALVNQETVWDPGSGYVAVPETQSFCCIGVSREVLNPGWALTTNEYQVNNEWDYERVKDACGIDRRTVDHLIELNDERNRDFRFIARFLRKVWGLTGVG